MKNWIVSIIAKQITVFTKDRQGVYAQLQEMKLKREIKLLQAVSKVLVMEVLWNGLKKRHCGCSRACT